MLTNLHDFLNFYLTQKFSTYIRTGIRAHCVCMLHYFVRTVLFRYLMLNMHGKTEDSIPKDKVSHLITECTYTNSN